MTDRDIADRIARIKIDIESILGSEMAEAYARELTFAVAEQSWASIAMREDAVDKIIKAMEVAK